MPINRLKEAPINTKRILAALAILGLAGSACSGVDGATAADIEPQTTPPGTSIELKITAVTTTIPLAADAPAGFEYHEVSAAGFRVAVPNRWAAIDLTAQDVADVIAELELDAATEEMILQGVAGGVSFMAVDVLDDTNINVLAAPRSAVDSLDNIASLTAVQIEELFGGTIVSSERVDVANTESLRIVYEVDFGTGPAEGHQYWVLTDTDAFVVTFTAFSAEADRAVFAQVMESFEPVA